MTPSYVNIACSTDKNSQDLLNERETIQNCTGISNKDQHFVEDKRQNFQIKWNEIIVAWEKR
jgi:hypothetical protein